MSAFAIPLAFVVCWLTLAGLLRRRHALPMDHPNARSLHKTPTPRIGGLGMMAGMAAAGIWLGDPALSPALFGALVLAGMSLLDDWRGLPVGLRFLVHFAVAAACLSVLGFSGWGLLVGTLATVWMTNLYNFMDGANGLAGGMAAIGFGALGLAAFWGGEPQLAAFCVAIAAAALAFLRYNFPAARLFMGDAGSIPLGFLAAMLGFLGAKQGVWPIAFPLLVFSPFITDASVTLARRVLRGERIWHAHRSHYYQRVVRLGVTHARMTLAAWGLMLLQAMIAFGLLVAPRSASELFILSAAFHLGVLLAIDRRWHRRFPHES